MAKYKAKNFIVEAIKCSKYEYKERYSPGIPQHFENKYIIGYEISWCGFHFFLPEEKFNELYEELKDDLSSNESSRPT